MEHKMTDKDVINTNNKPGSYLAAEREKRGISIEHIANKLNLRSQVLVHLEADEYEALPQPVFVKGYIRAYCKHLDLNCADELIKAYVAFMPLEPKFERHMWQTQLPKESESSERWLKWVMTLFVGAALVAVGMWWYENKPQTGLIPSQLLQQDDSAEQLKAASLQNESSAALSNESKDDLSQVRQNIDNKPVEQNIVVPNQLSE